MKEKEDLMNAERFIGGGHITNSKDEKVLQIMKDCSLVFIKRISLRCNT